MPAILSPVHDQFGGDMAGLDVADMAWSVPLHDKPSLKAHKPLRKRRDYLDNLEYVSAIHLDQADPTKEPKVVAKDGFFDQQSSHISSPTLPLTPPSASGDDTPQAATSESDVTLLNAQSKVGTITPRAQNTPPTPDDTPPRPRVSVLQQEKSDMVRAGQQDLSRSRWNPQRAISSSSTQSFPLSTPEDRLRQGLRPFLGTQPSISSRAESFKTAREEFSDDDSTTGWFSPRFPFQQSSPHSLPTTPDLQPIHEIGESHKRSKLRHEMSSYSTVLASSLDGVPPAGTTKTPENVSARGSPVERLSQISARPTSPQDNHRPRTLITTKRSATPPVELPAKNRGPRIEVAQEEDCTVDDDIVVQRTRDFSNAIGRLPFEDSRELKQRVNSWRHSGLSSTSTVEAIVVDKGSPRVQKLRHTRKHNSLRSASSPIPQSNRTSWNSGASTEVHRLVRKPAMLSNEKRLNVTSEARRSVSDGSRFQTSVISQPVEPEHVESIPVVVIPERKSSLKSSQSSSRRQSISTTQGSGARRSEDSTSTSQSRTRLGVRPRAMSDSSSGRLNPSIRGRDRHYPPTVPPRLSSLSAPTSRNGSRASSITSETLRMKRVAAEEDVRQTLARMTSDSVRPAVSTHVPSVQKEAEQSSPIQEVSATSGHLLPPPAPFTPFSQRSILTSSSPGEIHEATTVNYFPHNNESLQLIEGANITKSDHNHLEGEKLDGISTPPRFIPNVVMDSPLKNPRNPPQPPAFKVIPPTPAVLTPKDELDRQQYPIAEQTNALGRKLGSFRRALSAKRRSDSSKPSLVRSLGTSQARNRRQDEELDDKLHPFWRPRSFWDDYSDSETDSEPNDEDIVVNNSLGMPQSRIIFDGPLSLVRKLSDRRGQHDRGVVKRASLNSLTGGSSLRNTHIVHPMTDIRSRLHVLRMSNVHGRLSALRERLDEQKLEKRREELRRRIGPTVVARGDSRYPISPTTASGNETTSWPRKGAPYAY